MIYYTLPQINYNINASDLKLIINKKKNYDNNLCSLKKYLSKIKGLIDNHLLDWDNVKKYTNSYEFIHTVIPNQKISISKIKPISRAFFKLIEIYNTHDIFVNNIPIKSFHLAEGPGGFIEATAYIRDNLNDKYHGMTLINDNTNTPNWKKAENVLNTYKNIKIENGADNTGNLYNHLNLLHCKKKYKNSMNIITADGGFDFSNDYNNQEINAYRLIFTQITYAIIMQKYNGHFILKIFDIFEKCTTEILYILSCFYKKIIICKPDTSRVANSEKYIVCKFFKYSDTENISKKFINIIKVLEKVDFNEYTISSMLNIPIHFYFIKNVLEINAILGHQQIENILYTIKIITYKDRKHEKILSLKHNNIHKATHKGDRGEKL